MRVPEGADERAFASGRLERGVDLLDRHVAVEKHGEVDERAVDDGHAQRDAVEPTLPAAE